MDSMAQEKLLKQLNERAAIENSKVKIAFDPARDTIVNDSASYLVGKYELNLAYKNVESDPTKPRVYDSYRAVRYPNCTRQRAQSDDSYHLSNTLHSGVCELHILGEAPPMSALTTDAKWSSIKVKGRTVSRVDMVIKRPDGRKGVLVFYPGRSELSWVAREQVASALGLRPRSAGSAGMLGPDDVDRLIGISVAKSGSFKYAWLDILVQRDPSSTENLSAAKFEPTEIAKRGEALMLRFEEMAPRADKARYWRFVGELLARLPESDWLRFRDRIAAAMMLAPPRETVAQLKLIHRMTDMGSDAGPVLAHTYSADLYKNEIAIAACKVGAPIAPHMGRALLASWAAQNAPQLVGFNENRRWRERGLHREWRREQRRQEWERCTEDGKKNGPPADITFSACWAVARATPDASPTYLALRRMGLGTQADDMMKHEYSIHWKKTYDAIGPSSSPTLCGESKEM
jgi:hypothetical protein